MALVDLSRKRSWNLERSNSRGARQAPPLLLLHGFTGSAEEMLEATRTLDVPCQRFALDLPGHGRSTPVDSFDEALHALTELLDAIEIERADLWGYSLGGRIALALALEHPERVGRLILESASPGLEAKSEREARRAEDETLAARIEREGVLAFVNAWEALPLFAGEQKLPTAERERMRAIRLSHQARPLAQTLRTLGPGAQPSLWGRLHERQGPTLLVSGADDAKFTALAERMSKQISDSQRAQVARSGHAPHREQPDATCRAVATFLRETRN